MKKIMPFVFIFLCSTVTASENNAFKSSVLNGYKNRCNEVLDKKGYTKPQIFNECTCEVNIIDKHFSTFSLMLAASRNAAGAKPLNEKDVTEIRLKLKQCKLKK